VKSHIQTERRETYDDERCVRRTATDARETRQESVRVCLVEVK